MNARDDLYQQILALVRAGKTDDQILAEMRNCGCMGCPSMYALPDYTGSALSLEAARSAVRKLVAKHCECGRNCRCQCTLPAEVKRRDEVRAMLVEMIGRARDSIAWSPEVPDADRFRYDARDSFTRKDESPIAGGEWITGELGRLRGFAPVVPLDVHECGPFPTTQCDFEPVKRENYILQTYTDAERAELDKYRLVADNDQR